MLGSRGANLAPFKRCTCEVTRVRPVVIELLTTDADQMAEEISHGVGSWVRGQKCHLEQLSNP